MARAADSARRQFGTVRRLPSGRYQARYTGPDLERHTAPRTFETNGDAYAWLRAEERLVELDVWTSPADRAAEAEAAATIKVLTVEEYGQGWLTERDLRPKTRAEYRRFWSSRITPYLGDYALADVTPAVIRSPRRPRGRVGAPPPRDPYNSAEARTMTPDDYPAAD
ncbi:hypothetical protein G6027_04875 [Dietzia sp. SLG310A2-38A2]|uniref:hypothetical protein n=1 Tax=Dietzia sp. SLG310A2-38A2 TaxID=1630643 RepID=UPI0015F92231|nr:hypothetical protein [Dietzia sp. SLG310A2-38A2]MBB1030228.1 hypothetical protein [Dietzia sp. SLG310A2-38A2]